MDFEQIATGSLKFGGCADYSMAPTISAEYEVGDILYEKKKAQKGVLRKHCIKKVQANSLQESIRYMDTFNAFFAESELITYDEAVALARAAVAQMQDDLENHIINCSD